MELIKKNCKTKKTIFFSISLIFENEFIEVEKICDGSAFLGVDEEMGGNVDEDHQCDRSDAKVERI